MGGSIPQSADIQFDVAPRFTDMVCVSGYQLPNFAMLNCGIIERDACVITWVCLLATVTLLAASNRSHQLHELLQELLLEILKKGLTTMLLPCTFRTGQCLL